MKQFPQVKRILLVTCITLLWIVVLELGSRILIATKLVDVDKKTLLLYRGPTIPLPEIPRKKPQTFRIFIYGGSTTEGAHLPRIGYVEQLKIQLTNLLKVPVEIYNFGFSAYTSTDDRFIVERTIKYEPDLLIIYTSHNEFVYPSALPYHSFVLQKLEGLTLLKVGAWLADELTFRKPSFIVTPFQDSEKYKERFDVFTQNMSSITRLSRLKQVPLLFITAVANLADWPPSSEEKIFSGEAWQEYQSDEKEVTFLLQNNSKMALSTVNALVTKYPQSAKFRYLRGSINKQLQLFDEAKKDFLDAKNLDVVPWRALSVFNDYVRSLADNSTVYVFDAELYFEQKADHGFVGYDYIIDNVHLTTFGKYLMGRGILESLISFHLLPQNSKRENVAPLDLEEIIAQISPSKEELYMEHLLTSLYVIKPPFFNYERAEYVLDQAFQIRQDDWRLWVTKATLSLAKNEIDHAKEELVIAYRLSGGPIDTNDFNNVPTLGYLFGNTNPNNQNVLGMYISK